MSEWRGIEPSTVGAVGSKNSERKMFDPPTFRGKKMRRIYANPNVFRVKVGQVEVEILHRATDFAATEWSFIPYISVLGHTCNLNRSSADPQIVADAVDAYLTKLGKAALGEPAPEVERKSVRKKSAKVKR